MGGGGGGGGGGWDKPGEEQTIPAAMMRTPNLDFFLYLFISVVVCKSIILKKKINYIFIILK